MDLNLLAILLTIIIVTLLVCIFDYKKCIKVAMINKNNIKIYKKPIVPTFKNKEVKLTKEEEASNRAWNG